MTFTQIIRILWAHRRVEFAILAAVLLVALAFSLLMPKQYTATAALFVDVRSPDPIAGIVLPGIASSGYMATQVDIVKSDRVAQSVVSTLGLDQRISIREKWMKATGGRLAFHAWIQEFLQKNLLVQPARESSVINITFTGDTPEFAAEAANAFAQAYITVTLELKLEPARLYATWFEDQTRLARERLEVAQQALSDYQQKVGILVSDDRVDFETAKLSETSSQLTNLQAETTASRNKRKAPGANSIEDVMKNEVVNALRIDVARLDAKLKESSESLGPNHPQVVRTQQELAAMKTQLADQIRLVTASIETSYQIGKQRESDLERAVADQKSRVLALSKHRNELNVYMRDIESAQRAFEAVSQRAAQTRLESLSNQTNVVSLSAAKPPTRTSRPRLLFNVLIAACLGSMLAIGVGLILEAMNRRIRSQEDLALLALPVLASISSSQRNANSFMWKNKIQNLLGSKRKAVTNA